MNGTRIFLRNSLQRLTRRVNYWTQKGWKDPSAEHVLGVCESCLRLVLNYKEDICILSRIELAD